MNVLKKIVKLFSALKYIKKIWRDGGITQVNVAQISYGKILKGKRVLVTGGSSGIGLAIAKKCLSEGAQVVITGRNVEKLKAARKELAGYPLSILSWDVSDISLINQKIRQCKDLMGGTVDILVNNAGVLAGAQHLFDLTEERWKSTISTNMKGPVFLTKAVCKEWIRLKHKGKIINISSMRGTLGCVDGPYGMSKWAVNGLTRGLGLEMAHHGIIVNGIAPGITDTASISIDIDSSENAYLKCVPVTRIGLPEDIAELAVFLMSDAANYIVGQTIICDGGYTLKA